MQAFLQASFGGGAWQLSLPHGWGGETYFAQGGEEAYFVKLGVQIARYQAMACLGLTPPVLASGSLPDGIPLIVQPRLAGREPDRRDYRRGLEQVAATIHRTHTSPELQRTLPPAPSPLYREVGFEVLADIQPRWARCRPLVPDVADFVDDSLQALAGQVAAFEGARAGRGAQRHLQRQLAADGRGTLVPDRPGSHGAGRPGAGHRRHPVVVLPP